MVFSKIKLDHFKDCIPELKTITKNFRNENQSLVSEIEEMCPDVPKRLLNSAVYAVVSDNQVSLRISLFNTKNLVNHLSLILETLPIPYKIRIDLGYSCITPSKDLFFYHPSRSSCINPDNAVISNLESIEDLMTSLGWMYQPPTDYERDDALLLQKTIDRHDELFGLYTNSKFIMGNVYYMELYITCDIPLLDLWSKPF